ncbi:hypothetical protein PENSPDRAFT_756425 [Peniophora sp. CONT]|nr:hypothetical protein PENSPDRAFT_756425 [Peniophora sp. CONT]
MSTPPSDGSLNWRRGELPRGDDGRRLWDHSPPKSSDDSGSPSRAVALFPARQALHSAFPIVESADSSSEAGDAKADDESSERSALDWSQDSLQASSGPHTPSAQRVATASRGQFDWKPTMNQFSEKLRREQNNIKFFDEETPEAAGILKLVDEDDDDLLKGQGEPSDCLSHPRGFLDADATKRRTAGPATEHQPSKAPVSAMNVAPKRDTFPSPIAPSLPVPPPQPAKIPTSITETIAQSHSNRSSQSAHVPRSITDLMARPKSPPRTSVPASITEQFVKPAQHIPLPPQAFNMTIAELVALARQALPPPISTSPPTQSPPLPVHPPVPASITQLLPNQPPIPTSITDLIARGSGSPSGSSVSSGMSNESGSPWLSFHSSPGPRSPSAASSASTSPPPHSFAGYPTVTTNTLQNRLSSPTMYNSRPAVPVYQKGPGPQQTYNWGPVSPPSNPTRGLPHVNSGPVSPYGPHADTIPRSTNGTGRNQSGAYAQWPGSQYAVHRN